jgi:hypothetical protein
MATDRAFSPVLAAVVRSVRVPGGLDRWVDGWGNDFACSLIVRDWKYPLCHVFRFIFSFILFELRKF